MIPQSALGAQRKQGRTTCSPLATNDAACTPNPACWWRSCCRGGSQTRPGFTCGERSQVGA